MNRVFYRGATVTQPRQPLLYPFQTVFLVSMLYNFFRRKLHPWQCITYDFDSGHAIEIGLEHAPLVVFIYFFPHLNMQKPADYGPQQP